MSTSWVASSWAPVASLVPNLHEKCWKNHAHCYHGKELASNSKVFIQKLGFLTAAHVTCPKLKSTLKRPAPRISFPLWVCQVWQFLVAANPNHQTPTAPPLPLGIPKSPATAAPPCQEEPSKPPTSSKVKNQKALPRCGDTLPLPGDSQGLGLGYRSQRTWPGMAWGNPFRWVYHVYHWVLRHKKS